MKNSNAAVAALLFVVFASVNLGLFSSEPLFAAVSQVERTDDELLILEVHVNDKIRNKGIMGYLPDPSDLNGTLLPLSSFSRALSFSIKASPTDGTAEGWFTEQKNSFHLDLERKSVIVKGKEMTLPEGGAEAHFEDIYVRASLLAEWFEITIRPDIGTLRLYADSKTPFPFEEELLRKEKYKNAGGGEAADSASIPYDPKSFVPYGMWSLPSFVLQESMNLSKSPGHSSLTNSFSLQSSADILRFGSKMNLSGSWGTDQSPAFDNASLTFQKSDPENDLLGFLHAGKIEFGDITFQEVPLAVGSKRGRGVRVSSESDYNFAQTFGAEQYDLEGDAPVGWDAELYRNGYFINYQQVGDDGRYHFDDVDLVRGFNLFQVVLFGPDGQKQIQKHKVVRGGDLLREGEVRYDFSVGQPDADFLPLTENEQTSSEVGGGGHFSYGLKEYLTLGASVFTGQDYRSDPDSDEDVDRDYTSRQISGAVSATVAVKSVKAQVQAMKANEGRGAYSVDATTNLLDANVSAGAVKYHGYSPDDKDLLQQANISVNRNFGAFSSNVSVEKNTYQEKQDETVVNAGVTTRALGFQINNQIEYVESQNEAQQDFRGELAVMKSIKDWRTHANLTYDLNEQSQDKLRGVNISASRSFKNDSSLRLAGDYNFISNTTSADARYTRQYEKFSLDVNLGATSAQSYFGGVTLRTGLIADPEGKYKLVSAKKGGLGAVGLRAYMDENGNKKYDEGEKLIPNLNFRSNRGLIEDKTDENGYVFINGLSESPTRFTPDQESMPSIYIRPLQESLDIIPRSGTVVTMDMGFEQMGEIDGFLYAGSEDQPMAGMEVILVNGETGEEIDSISAEQDGYFVFSSIPMGKYRLDVIPIWGDAGHISVARIVLDHKNPMSIDHKIMLPETAYGGAVAENKEKDKPGTPAMDTAKIADKQKVQNVIDDASARVVTDGTDISTGEVLRGLYVHVGSVSDLKSAEDERKRLWELYPAILGDIPLYIYKISLGEKIYFRVVGAVDEKIQGKKLCADLISAQSIGGCSLQKL